MTGFDASYLGKLRQTVGNQILLSPGVQVLLLRSDGRALVQRRSDSGIWEFPAGSCEPGESFRTAAVTELQEETGITLTPAELVPFATLSNPELHTLTYPNGDLVHAFTLCFWATSDTAHASVNDGEATEHQWVATTDLPSPFHPPAVAVLRMFEEYRRTGLFQAD